MKIVINALSARRGGGQTYLLNLLRNLEPSAGMEIYVFASKSLRLPEHSKITRLEVGWSTENPVFRTLWEIFLLPIILKKMNADVLFCPGGVVATRASKNCKTITMFRNMIPFDMVVRKKYPIGLMRVRNWLLERVMFSSMIKSDLVIFISEFARKVIVERPHGQIRKAVTISHGISNNFRVANKHLIPRPKWLPTGEYLLYVSIFDVYKNQLEVVRGYHLLKSRRETKEKLILAGHHTSPSGLRVIEEIERLGLQNDIILPGNIDYQELPAVYAHAKITIFASSCENCPNILLEALGAGRPLLVSNVEPMPEFGGDAVIYFDPLSPEDFAEKVMKMIDSPEELEKLGQKVAEQAEKFDWVETARSTWQTIRELSLEKERN